MKMLRILLPLLAIAATSARAVNVIVDFDALNSGDPANNDAAVTGFSFSYGVLEPLLDSFGVPIPGSDHWVTDIPSGSATVSDTALAGYGAAPTGTLALDATPQPVLLTFSGPVDLTSFAVTLDNSPFGFDGFNAEFYGAGDVLLGSVPVIQSSPGYLVSASGLSGVSYLMLPSGAMYDHFVMNYAPVPEPGSALLMLGALVPLARRRRPGC